MVLIWSSHGRCDARCYEAEGGECDCICGGRNHGVGLKRAVENNRELFREDLERLGAKVFDPWETPEGQQTLF